ncbi:hypothetical protein LOCC1_G008416, partial [Lachnellula occidentalis]
MAKVEVICSLFPVKDEKTAIGLLKARPDLDTLFALHCKYQDLSKDRRADPSNLTVVFKANELWRKFRMPLGYGESPWDWNWQPPRSGIASKIADEFHAAVGRAIFRIPFFDFVKWALGSDALCIGINAVLDVRDSLQKTILDVPGTKNIYVEVEKILESRHLKLAHWTVACSLSNSPYPLHSALALIQDPVQNLFATRNLDFVLERLPVFDQRFYQINQEYNWVEWSTDFDFWDHTYQALWSEIPRAPTVNSDMLLEDMDERLRFLRSFASVHEDK